MPFLKVHSCFLAKNDPIHSHAVFVDVGDSSPCAALEGTEGSEVVPACGELVGQLRDKIKHTLN